MNTNRCILCVIVTSEVLNLSRPEAKFNLSYQQTGQWVINTASTLKLHGNIKNSIDLFNKKVHIMDY